MKTIIFRVFILFSVFTKESDCEENIEQIEKNKNFITENKVESSAIMGLHEFINRTNMFIENNKLDISELRNKQELLNVNLNDKFSQIDQINTKMDQINTHIASIESKVENINNKISEEINEQIKENLTLAFPKNMIC